MAKQYVVSVELLVTNNESLAKELARSMDTCGVENIRIDEEEMV